MVTFTVYNDWEDGRYPGRYSYEKGELVSKYDGIILIGSSLPIVSGDVLRFTIRKRKREMRLWIWDEENEMWMGYAFNEGQFYYNVTDYTKW